MELEKNGFPVATGQMDELEGTLEIILSNFSIKHEETKSWGHIANYSYKEHQIAKTGSEILCF